MRGRLVLLGRVAAETPLAAGRAKLAAVRLVAVGARYAAREHLRLQKRAVLVDFLADLPIGGVEGAVDERDAMRIAERPAVRGVVGELTAAGGAARPRPPLT